MSIVLAAWEAYSELEMRRYQVCNDGAANRRDLHRKTCKPWLSEKGSDQEGAPNEQKTFRLARDREKILDRIGN